MKFILDKLFALQIRTLRSKQVKDLSMSTAKLKPEPETWSMSLDKLISSETNTGFPKKKKKKKPHWVRIILCTTSIEWQSVSFGIASIILSELDKTYEKIYHQGWKPFCALYLESSHL